MGTPATKEEEDKRRAKQFNGIEGTQAMTGAELMDMSDQERDDFVKRMNEGI